MAVSKIVWNLLNKQCEFSIFKPQNFAAKRYKKILLEHAKKHVPVEGLIKIEYQMRWYLFYNHCIQTCDD